MTFIIQRSGRLTLNIVQPGALPTWLSQAISGGLGLYQWYKLDPTLASRPNGYWSKNTWGSQAGLVAPGDIDPDVDFRPDPNFPGFQWQHQSWQPNNTTIGHGEPVTETGQTVPNVTNYVSRHIDSAFTTRRSGSVLLLHGAGHNSSWRNDVAEIHLGSNNVTRQVITPATPYDMIRYCSGPGTGTHPQHYQGQSWQLASQGGDRFHTTHYLDGRPVAGHCGYRNMFIDELDLMVTMGTGLMRPAGGYSGHVEAWRWSTKDWDKPAGYVSPSSTGPGLPLYGEVVPWPSGSATPGWPGASQSDFTQPMCKLVGQNTVIMASYVLANVTPARVYSYQFPGPTFTHIGTMTGMNTLTFPSNNYPLEYMVHDPVRNRILMTNNYIYRWALGLPSVPAGSDWRNQEGVYANARMGYLDLNLQNGVTTTNLYVPIPEATYLANPALRARTSGDPICYDENSDRYLMLFMKGYRDPRSNITGTQTYAGTGGLFAGQMPFNKLYAMNPQTFESLGELTVTPDPIYGVPPGIFRGSLRQFSYLPELKICVYFSDAVDRTNPTVANTSTTAYGAAGGHFVWIMRVG